MNSYSLSHLSDGVLLRDLAVLVSRDRAITAALLAHLAEVDERKLYVPAGYSSMYGYCVQELHFSEDSAYKRIRAARTARRFPAVFAAVADGRLNLNAIVLLAPHLTGETAGDLLVAAAGKTRPEIELLLAQRFPQPDLSTGIEAIPAQAFGSEALVLPSPEAQQPPKAGFDPDAPVPVARDMSCQLAARPVGPAVPRARVSPLAPERYALQVTIDKATHDKLRYAQELLGHAVPSGDVAQVLDRALDALIERLEKRKIAATDRPRPSGTRSANPRSISAHVRRTVWERDRGRCTFVAENGHRCGERRFLEFDHVEPVARGGRATENNLRLRCRAHNQYEAERTFGAGFMSGKRERARCALGTARARPSMAAAGQASESATTNSNDVIPWLRQLGFRADEAKRAAEKCEAAGDAPLEERVRLALRSLAPAHRRVAAS
jgi:hypothetical protein